MKKENNINMSEKYAPKPDEAIKKEVRRPTEAELDQKARYLFDFHIESSRKIFDAHEFKDAEEYIKYWILTAIGSLRDSAAHPEKNEEILGYYEGYNTDDLNKLAEKLETLWEEKKSEDEKAMKAIDRVVSESE